MLNAGIGRRLRALRFRHRDAQAFLMVSGIQSALKNSSQSSSCRMTESLILSPAANINTLLSIRSVCYRRQREGASRYSPACVSARCTGSGDSTRSSHWRTPCASLRLVVQATESWLIDRSGHTRAHARGGAVTMSGCGPRASADDLPDSPSALVDLRPQLPKGHVVRPIGSPSPASSTTATGRHIVRIVMIGGDAAAEALSARCLGHSAGHTQWSQCGVVTGITPRHTSTVWTRRVRGLR